MLKRFIQLLKPEKGVMVTRRATGHLELQGEVAQETGTVWHVKALFWRFGYHTGGEDKLNNWHRGRSMELLLLLSRGWNSLKSKLT